MTRLINLLGAYVGGEDAALTVADDNPKGFWERKDTVASNDAILASAGCTWDQLASWSFRPVRDEWAAEDTREAMSTAIGDLDAHKPWVLKDPRLCLTLPFWRPLLEHPVVVVVARNPADVATSLRARNGISLAHALAIFEYSAVGVLVNARGLPTVRVSYDEALADPVETVARLKRDLEACGVTGLHDADPAAVTSFVDASLHRSKPDRDALDGMLSPRLVAIDAALRGQPHALPDPLEPSLVAVTTMEVRRQIGQERSYIQAIEGQMAAGRDDREHLDARLLFERSEHDSTRATAAAEVAGLQAAVADRDGRIDALAGQLAAMTAERDQAQARIQTIVASADWRWSVRLGRLFKAIGLGR